MGGLAGTTWAFIYLTGCVIVLVTECQGSDHDVPVVSTLFGNVSGERHVFAGDVSLNVFKGIPYTRPPVGALRFARPEFPPPWRETLKATTFGAWCMQKQPFPTQEMNEDCLYLNIFAPAVSDSTRKFPVMFWIHGGAYRIGSGAQYDGSPLAAKGIVVVTINYRLDVFGYLSTTDKVIPGNFGMLDQVLALDWVRENIAEFGGDPQDITLAGESAGASSVSLHLISPLSKGKFQKAIMQSGVSLCPWAVNPSNTSFYTPSLTSTIAGLAVGCTHLDSESLLSCLRLVPAERLLKAGLDARRTLDVFVLWQPVVETTFGFLPNKPLDLYRAGKAADVPVIRGFNSDEASLFLLSEEKANGYTENELRYAVSRFAYSNYIEHSSEISAMLFQNYGQVENDPMGRRNAYIRMTSDMTFIAPIMHEAHLHLQTQTSTKSYIYEVSYRPSFSPYPEWAGVTHCDELSFVFGLTGSPMYEIRSTNSDDVQVSQHMIQLWTDFIKFGNPTPKDVSGVSWPAFERSRHQLLDINVDLRVKSKNFNRLLSLWTETIPQLQKGNK